MSLMLSLVMLMQVGADPHVYPQAPLPAITPRRKPVTTAPPLQQPNALGQCMAAGRADAEAGEAWVRAWLARATTPDERAQADECLGLLLTDAQDFAGAQAAFADALAAIPADETPGTVPLLAMAGNAALGNADWVHALDWFDRALAVHDYDDHAARGAIMADRARALVALGRNGDADGALTAARTEAPGDAGVFLLSATLARREQKLAAAQGFIETAASLNPRDPAIGLEAGVIAVLAGHDGAARKSWNSVLAAAPDSDEAKAARGYLAQLGPGNLAPLDRPAPPPTSVGRH